jgi:hypothetical protein
MPLDKRCDTEAVSANIRKWLKEKADEARKAGRSREELHQQAIAVALSTLKTSCGVSSKAQMTPKEIVAAGRKEEARERTVRVVDKHGDVTRHKVFSVTAQWVALRFTGNRLVRFDRRTGEDDDSTGSKIHPDDLRGLTEAVGGTRPPHTNIGAYKLRVHGFGSEDLSKQIEKGIKRSADLCKISPPVCVGNLGVPRSKMPQLEPQPVVFSFLRDLKKEGVSVKKGKMHVGRLKATQRGIDVRKVLRMAKEYQQGKFPNIKDQIIVSSDDHVLDGHHRWAALVVTDPNETMNVLKVGMPMQALLAKANSYKGATKKAFGEEAFGLAGPPKIFNPVRVKPTTQQPKRPVHRKAKSGNEQPFIDPEDFVAHAGAGSRVKEGDMGQWADLMRAIHEDKNKDRDGSVRRTEFDIGIPEADLEDGEREQLQAFVLAKTREGHKFPCSDGRQGIVYADERGRAVKCAVEDLGDGELLWLAQQKGWRNGGDEEPTADPGYRKPVQEEVEEDPEAPFDKMLDEKRKLFSKSKRESLESGIWEKLRGQGGTKAPGVLKVQLTSKLAKVAGVGSSPAEIDLKDVADAMIERLARVLRVGGMQPAYAEDEEVEDVFDFLLSEGAISLDEKAAPFIANDLATGIQQVAYAYAANATKADGLDIKASSDKAMMMTPVIISNLVKMLGRKPVEDHIDLSTIILNATQEAAKDVLGISGRPDRDGENVVFTASRRLVASSGGRPTRMARKALKRLRGAKTLKDVGAAFQASA